MWQNKVKIVIAFCDIIIIGTATNVSHLEVTACYDNASYFELLAHKPRVVDVVTGFKVDLLCQLCEGKEDYFPKLWFYKQRGSHKQRSVLSEIDNNDFSTKVIISPVHTLSIYDFNLNNSGIYMCEHPEKIKNNNVFLYILEGVINMRISPKVGTSIQWQEYKRIYFDPINKKFQMSEEEPFKSLRMDLKITFKLTTTWENWGECKEIDHLAGVRKRIGRCRLQNSVINTTSKIMLLNVAYNSAPMSYLTDGYDISCRSLQLNTTVPKVSEIVKNIPDYEAEETCHVVKRVKHKTNQDNRKHKSTKQVEENSHVTLSCTEAVSNSDVIWFKDAKLLNSLRKYRTEEEPHISVDTNNSLHILHITKKEEGNYSCLSNGKKVQEFEVTVLSKSKLLNEEFIRYSIYLGFVLSLAMTCYCAGVCIAWHRRSSFVDPLNINKKGIHKCHRLHCEQEKLLK